MVEVVAALIFDEGRILICQRPQHKARGLMWEFVGGKVEPGETKAQALVRECREELAITVSVGTMYAEVTHEYPDIRIRLTLFRCTIEEGVPTPLEHAALLWVRPSQLRSYSFCPADEEIIKMLEAIPD